MAKILGFVSFTLFVEAERLLWVSSRTGGERIPLGSGSVLEICFVKGDHDQAYLI